jgi:inhibitor of KinA
MTTPIPPHPEEGAPAPVSKDEAAAMVRDASRSLSSGRPLAGPDGDAPHHEGGGSPRFLDAGETALVVEFGTTVEPAINDRVLALDDALIALRVSGVHETVPTYRSLMIHYDPLVLDRQTLIDTVGRIEAAPAKPREPAHLWTIPCCYDPVFAEDLAEIAAMTKLTPERVVALHSGATYRVYMYGFSPGFCYLGGVPAAIQISRRVTPRPPHPANTILLGGGLTLVSTFSMPTGWWLIGRTPERMFAPARERVFLVDVGDALRFAPVDRAEFDALEARVAAGEIVAKQERLR